VSDENGTSLGSAFVVDASVAVKWFLQDEEYSDDALLVLEDLSNGLIALFAPEQIVAEVGSALSVASLPSRKRLLQSAAAESLSTFLEYRLTTTPSRELAQEAFALSHQHGCAFYDMLYLALANRMGIPLVIADQKLRVRVGHLPEVLWIADFARRRRTT
jgi:predicted nucleic acid-binding protein